MSQQRYLFGIARIMLLTGLLVFGGVATMGVVDAQSDSSAAVAAGAKRCTFSVSYSFELFEDDLAANAKRCTVGVSYSF